MRAKPLRSRMVVIPKSRGKKLRIGMIESRMETKGVKLSGQKEWTRIQCFRFTKIWSRAVMLASQEWAREWQVPAAAERKLVLMAAAERSRRYRQDPLPLPRQPLSLSP